MSEDGDMMRSIDILIVKVAQAARDEEMSFGEQVELWKDCARYIDLSNQTRIENLWGSSDDVDDNRRLEWEEESTLFRKLFMTDEANDHYNEVMKTLGKGFE